jgi:hypothetical protein
MKHSERFALNQYLAEYPEISYSEILEMLFNGDFENITQWSVFENRSGDQIAEFIDITKNDVERMMDDLVWGLCLSDKTEEESKKEGITE